MRVLHDICNILEDELEDIVKTGGISHQDLEIVDTSVDIIKDITTINAMKENDYNRYSRDDGMSGRMYYDDEMTMARGGRGGGRMSRDGYTRHDEKEMLQDKIDELKRQLNQMR